MRVKQQYIVETADGRWMVKTRNWRGPRVNKGMVNLWGKAYAINPKRYRRRQFKTFPYFRTHDALIQVWREDDPEAIDFLANNGNPSPNMSSSVISEFAKSERLHRLVAQETDWKMVLLIVAVFGLIILGGLLYYASRSGH